MWSTKRVMGWGNFEPGDLILFESLENQFKIGELLDRDMQICNDCNYKGDSLCIPMIVNGKEFCGNAFERPIMFVGRNES